MEKIYDICAKTGQYEQNGQTKNRYINVGSIFKDDNGNPFMFLNAHFNPAGIERRQGSDSIILSLFAPKDRQQSQEQPQQQSQQQQQPLQQQPRFNQTARPSNDFSQWEQIPF